MRRFVLFASMLALLLATIGCIELDEEFTLNPDGSGKVAVHWIGSPLDFGAGKGAEARAKSFLKDEVTQCEGVDAWQDVSCVVRPDGKYEFKGTAYFRDASQLKLHNSGLSVIALKASKDAEGNLVIRNDPEQKRGAGKRTLSDEEAKQELTEERAQYRSSKPMMQGMLGELRVSARVNLPGKVGDASNFKRTSDTSVQIELEGKKLIAAMDELMMDDAWMLKQIRESGGLQNAAPDDEVVAQKVFGEKGPVRATTTGELHQLFDYEAEAGVARAAWDEFAQSLGAGPLGPIGPPAQGGDFKSLRVSGVRYVFENDSERGLGFDSPGLTVSFIGELPGTVLKMKELEVHKAVTDTGENLLSGADDQSSFLQVQLSTDNAAVAFDVRLALPGKQAKGFGEISGVLTYLTSGATKEVDLGLTEFKAGAAGTQFGATINSVEESQMDDGRQSLELQVELPTEQIKSIVFKDEAGGVLETMGAGSWSIGDTTTYTFTFADTFPAKGKVIVNVYDDIKAYEIPFKVENVDLLGRK